MLYDRILTAALIACVRFFDFSESHRRVLECYRWLDKIRQIKVIIMQSFI